VRALVKSIGVNASALYIALFLFIYCTKNKEYCLDMIGLECLYHTFISFSISLIAYIIINKLYIASG
jgi:hypothetical protein